MELFIYQRGTGFIGEISEYLEIEEERNYYEYSKLLIRVVSNQDNINLLSLGNIIFLSNNINYPYYVDHFSIVKEGSKEIIEVYCFSLNYLLSFRTILRQVYRTGNIENVVKAFISDNLISSTDSDRNFNQLVLGPNRGINRTVRVSLTGGILGDSIFNLLRENESSIDFMYNPTNNNFEVTTWQGLDRSIQQQTNNHVIFSQEYDNILNRNYFIDRLNYKNITVVAGEGEGINRTLEIIGSASGWDRREDYVDARDLQSQTFDDNGNTIILTSQEYSQVLITRGLENNSDKVIIESFQAAIDRSQFIINEDFGIGDLVTFQDNNLNVLFNLRVTQVLTTYSTDGIKIVPSFGTNLPNNFR